MQSQQAIRFIKERLNLADIVRRYVDLKPNGARLVAPCPFHQETKPSFSVNPEKGFFYCFGCHASGDIFEFYAKINGLDFRECLEQLAAEAGITVEYSRGRAPGPSDNKISDKRQIMLMHEVAASHFQRCLAGEEGNACRQYLLRRGVTPELTKKFELGWAPKAWHSLADELRKRGFDKNLACDAGLLSRSDNGVYDRFRGRLMFPIKNLSGQTIAFGGRIIDNGDEAKYINSADTPIYKKKEHLYGLFQARRAISASGEAMLTEGYMDVLALNQFGFANCAGVLGTALTEEQIRRLSGFASRILLIFDGDRPGRKAALRACELLLTRGLACNVVILPAADDIDSLLRSGGPESFNALRGSAPDGLAYCLGCLKELAPRDAVNWAREFLARIQIPELVSPYASRLAAHLQISEPSLRQGACRPGRVLPASGKSNLDTLVSRDTQIMIYAVRYPERLEELREMGADLALTTPRARQLWALIEQWGPDDVFYHLDARQKEFWLAQRTPGAAPRTSGDFELTCLSQALSAYYSATQKLSLNAALSENAGSGAFETQLEYLRAIQETLGKGNEQS